MKKSLLLLVCITFATNIFAAKKGGVFKYNLSIQPPTLHPLKAQDVPAQTVENYTMSSLLSRNSDTYEWQADLAEKWEVSKDGKVFDFFIRKGVKFHTGKELTAKDVVFTFNAITDKSNKYKTAHLMPYYQSIEKVEAVNDYHVRFTTKNVYFKNFDIAAGMSIVPEHVYKKDSKKLNKKIVGSGPYKFKEYKKGKHIILERNKDWYGLKVPHLKDKYNFDRLLMKFIKEDEAELQRFQRGDLDMMGLKPEYFVKRTKGGNWGKTIEKVKTKNSAAQGYGFIGFNLKKDIFKSKNVRKALSHLFNRKLMIDKFRFNMAVPATGPIYKGSYYYNPNVKAPKFDQDLALKILRKEGWKDTDGDQILDKVIDGKKVKLSFSLANPSKDTEKYLTIFKEDAKKVGVDINIKLVEWTNFVKLLNERKFDTVVLAWGAGSVEWDPKQIWHSDSIANQGSNFVGYSNKKVDELIDKARVTLDRKKRAAILKQVHKLIAEDYPYIFWFNNKNILYGYNKQIKRLKDSHKYEIGLSHWSIAK